MPEISGKERFVQDQDLVLLPVTLCVFNRKNPFQNCLRDKEKFQSFTTKLLSENTCKEYG